MSAPSATVAIEPLVNGKLVYLPMAPNTVNGQAQARLLVELTIANTSSVPLTATQVMITFPSGPAGGSRTINQTVKPFSSIGWNLTNGAAHFLFDLATAPTSAVVAVFFAGYSDPISSTLPVAAHTGPDTIGAYRFPSLAADLELGEFWQMNGCSHDPGNHQGFAYDMGVWGTEHGPNEPYSQLTTGGDPYVKSAPNSDYRIFGKPVRAMAAGEVIEIVNNCPDNPAPLYPVKAADMAGLLDGLKATYGAFTNGEAGNHVLVRHGDEVAVYAHLQKGSIDAGFKARKLKPGGLPPEPGTMVSAGQILGRAGNSGRSSAPHLHIHSEQPPYSSGGPRPMLFTGAWAIDNDTVGGPGAPAGGGEPAGGWVPLNGTGIPAGDPTNGSVKDSFLLPSGSPRWPESVHYSVEENEYQALYDAMNAKGMGPAWINTHTIEKGPFFFWTYFNVVFRPHLGRDEPAFHGLDATQFGALKTKQAAAGYHVKQLESYFSMRQGKQLFAGIFGRYGSLPPRKPARSYHAKSVDEHVQRISAWRAEGFVPTNISVVSVNGTRSYTALWEFRGTGVDFDLREYIEPASMGTIFQQNLNARRFMTYLKGYVHQGATFYSAIWTGGAPNGKVRTELRQSGFTGEVTKQRRGNHLLRSVSGYQFDGDVAYAGIWEA